MSKLKGSYKSAANVEFIASAPFDPRVKWDSWDSLTNFEDWPIDDNKQPYLYSGMIVGVNDGENGENDWNVYILNDINKWNVRPGESEESGWKKISGGGKDLVWEK